MKKILALILTLAVLCAIPAMAEGVITITKENSYITGDGNYYFYLFTRVENTGDAPIRITSGQLDVLDADGNVLATNAYPNRMAEYLQPGEYTYVFVNGMHLDVESPEQVADYNLTLETSDDVRKTCVRFPVETRYERDVPEGYWTYNYMTAIVTNDTDQYPYDMVIVQALLDDEDNILCMAYDNMYTSKCLLPGSSLMYRTYTSSGLEDYYEANGITPTHVDAFAYVSTEEPEKFVHGTAESATVTEAPAEAPAETPTEQPAEAPAEQPAEAPAEAPEEAPAYATLQKGSKGNEVRALQQRLKDLGYLTGAVDGDFGNGTAGAVSAFQTKAGLEANGIADDATQQALFADGAPTA